jgi:hypothetical protein
LQPVSLYAPEGKNETDHLWEWPMHGVMKRTIHLGSSLSTVFAFLLLACGGGGGGNSDSGVSPNPALGISAQPANTSVAEGQTATFTITATGKGPLSYQWRKDGTRIAGARFTRYTTPITSRSESGSHFSVLVTDATGGGVASREASLSVSTAVVPAQHYVDPVNGSDLGDGSSARPWKSLQEVLDHLVETRTWEGSLPYVDGKKLVAVNAGAPVKAGDTIWLRSGDYGALAVQSSYNAAPITIAAEPGEPPRFSSVLVRSSQNWILRGFSVSPSHGAVYSPSTMVTIENHNWRGPAYDIEIDGFQLFSVPDEGVWAARSDWDTKAANAVITSGDRILVRHCRIWNVGYGISLTGKGSQAEYNTIDGFCGDGLRGLGDDETFEYNLVKNARDVNDDHRDGFQSWSVGPGGVGTGVVRNIALRGNIIIGYEDPGLPFAGTLQGIGCYDGTYEGWLVENNVVITDHWHGISFYGAQNVRIVNNTVLDLNAVTPGPPWIMVTDHKSGVPSRNCVVRNNLTTALSVTGDGIATDHNILLGTNPAGFFRDLPHHDTHLAQGSPAIDQGSSELAPAIDADEALRGTACDVGAYEYAPGNP